MTHPLLTLLSENQITCDQIYKLKNQSPMGVLVDNGVQSLKGVE